MICIIAVTRTLYTIQLGVQFDPTIQNDIVTKFCNLQIQKIYNPEDLDANCGSWILPSVRNVEQESVLTFQMLIRTVLRSVLRDKLLQRAFHESTVVRRAVNLQLTTHHWWQSVRRGKARRRDEAHHGRTFTTSGMAKEARRRWEGREGNF